MKTKLRKKWTGEESKSMPTGTPYRAVELLAEHGDIREAQKIEVWLGIGYGGTVKAKVTVEGIEYVLDLDWLKTYLEKQMTEKGYTTSITNRQKYPRITINP